MRCATSLAADSDDLALWAGKVRGGLKRLFPLSSRIRMADSGAISRVERLGRTLETRQLPVQSGPEFIL